MLPGEPSRQGYCKSHTDMNWPSRATGLGAHEDALSHAVEPGGHHIGVRTLLPVLTNSTDAVSEENLNCQTP